MPKLCSSEFVARMLLRNGFSFVARRGSHAKFRKKADGTTLTAIVPMDRKVIPQGTLRSISRQADLQVDVFLE